MKKLLSLLAVTGLVTISSTSVLACGASNNNVKDDDLVERMEIRNRFISETSGLIQNHVSSRTSQLIHSEETAKNNGFLNIQNLNSIFDNNPGVIGGILKNYPLNENQNKAMGNDLDILLGLSTTLSDRIEREIRDQAKYSFLFQGLDSTIFENSSTIPNVTIMQNKGQTQDSVDTSTYTIALQLQVNFKFIFNSQIEDYNLVNFNLNFIVSDNEIIIDNILKIVIDVPRLLWENHSDLFRMTDKILKTEDSRFVDQSEFVMSRFEENDNANNLNEIIAKLIKEDLNLDETSISFKQGTPGALNRLYDRSFTHIIEDDGFIEQALFLKNSRITSNESKLREFKNNTDFSDFNIATFVETSQEPIKNFFGFDFDPFNEEFIEYGFLSLDDLKVSVLGIEININPINLLYIYNSTALFQQQVIQTFNQWHESWNITESDDRHALWKMTETNANNPDAAEMAANVWESMRVDPTTFLDRVNLDRETFYGESIAATGISNFHISHTNNRPIPHASVFELGFGVNYSGFGTGSRINSWRLIVNIDDVVINIDLVSNPNYLDNVWFGRGRIPQRHLIERT